MQPINEAAHYMQRAFTLKCETQDTLIQWKEAERSSLHGIDYSDRINGGTRRGSTERAAIKASQLYDRYIYLCTAWCRAESEAIDVISTIQKKDARAALYLTYSFISGYSQTEIATKLQLSTRRVYQIRQKALSMVCDIISAETSDDKQIFSI